MIQVKSGIIGKEIASRMRKWYWMLFYVKFKTRYAGLKSTGHLIEARLYFIQPVSNKCD